MSYRMDRILSQLRSSIPSSFYLSVFWFTILVSIYTRVFEGWIGHPLDNLLAYAVIFLPVIFLTSFLAGVTIEEESVNIVTVPLVAYLLVMVANSFFALFGSIYEGVIE